MLCYLYIHRRCVLTFCCRESVESLIHKHSYARSPIRTYTGEEEGLGEDGHATHSRGKKRRHTLANAGSEGCW